MSMCLCPCDGRKRRKIVNSSPVEGVVIIMVKVEDARRGVGHVHAGGGCRSGLLG